MMFTTRRLAGALAVVACAVTACSSTANPSASGPPTTVKTTTTVVGGQHPAETKAAELRAGLTGLLDAHVFLTAIATSASVSGADPAPAMATVTANLQGLGDVFTAAYDPDAGSKATQLWTGEANAFLAYAKAKAANDATASARAKADLDAFRSQFASFFNGINVNLTKQALSDELDTDVSSFLAVIDAQAAKSPTQYDAVASAANSMPHLAVLVAAAIAKQFPDRYPGTATGTAANLRAQLTSVLVSHAYLSAITTATSLGGGDAAAPTKTLDANSQAIADAFASVYGDAAGRRFAELWATHIGLVAGYARAAATSDSAGESQARSQLGSFGTDLGSFLAGVSSQLTQDRVATDFAGHIRTLLAAIDAQAAKSPSQFDLLRTAGEHMPMTADLWSEAIAEQFPDKFAA